MRNQLGFISIPATWVIAGLIVLSAFAGGYLKGYASGRDKLDDYIGAQAVAAVQVVTRQGAVTEKVVTRYVKVAGETETVVKEVERKVIDYAMANPDGLCLDGNWRVLHDAAVAGSGSRAPSSPDGGLRAPPSTPGGIRFPYRSPSTGDGDKQLREASPLRGSAERVAGVGH